MTAETNRRRLAAELQSIYGEYITQGSPDDWYEDGDRLLPVVRAIVAEELRAAADDFAATPGAPYPLTVSEHLRDRADDLEAGS